MTQNNDITRKLNLLLKAWLSDQDNLSDEAIETEEELIKEVRKELHK